MRKQIDLTTLPGWANLSSGNHTIKIKAKGTGYKESELSAGVTVSKAASTVTLEAGTYQFIEEPDVPIGTDIDENLTAVINTLIDNDVYGSQKTTTCIAVSRPSSAEARYVGIFNEEPYYEITDSSSSWQYTNENGDTFDANTDSSKLRTIVVTTDQTVSNELYKWAITDGNLVKLS